MARKISSQDALQGLLARKIDERLSPRDLQVLQACWSRQDIEVYVVSKHTVLWLIHHKLLGTFIDKLDRVWIETTQLGRDLVRHMRKGSACATAARSSTASCS